MPSLVAQGKVASTKPLIEAAASRMSGVFSLRTAFILAHAQGRCASVIRKPFPCALRALRPHAISDISLVYKRKFCLAAMRQASATCGGSRTFLLPPYKICASILKDLSALLRILWNGSESFLHKADAHVGDVTR